MSEKKKALMLKKTLTDTKNHVMNKLIYEREKLSADEQRVYSEWLNSINEIINICVERNKF